MFVFALHDHVHRPDGDPWNDLDLASYGVVKVYEDRAGTAYPDMGWEPKAAFAAVAGHYRAHEKTEARDRRTVAGFARGAGLGPAGLGPYMPTSFISMPTSVLVSRRSQPDFWSPRPIGPKAVRTSFSTGKPASASMRRTMCLRPSCSVTSTR